MEEQTFVGCSIDQNQFKALGYSDLDWEWEREHKPLE